ncbi:MAG TPA: DUF748 domain-containing protein [Anaeromyxobacter sp.]|nr:DUF748 domain-containing protein [Anaeromyxobacter sp.]
MKRALEISALVVGSLVVVLAAMLVAAQPLARWETRRVLSRLDGMRASFESVQVRVADLSYEIRGLHIDKVDEAGKGHPFLEVQRVRAGVYGHELLGGHLVLAVDLVEPRVTLVESTRKGERRTPESAGETTRRIERMTPLRIDRVQVRRGEVVWVDAREPEKPVLRLSAVEATLENFASRPSLARKQPTVLAARALLQRTGRVEAFATADPLAKTLTFAGQGSVRGLALADIATLLESKTDLRVTQGAIDVFARFQAQDGTLNGGVRPVLHGAKVKAGKPGVGPALKALIGDAALSIFKDKDTGTIATTIPIEGTVEGPETQFVPTVLGILRNAFVRGLEGGLSGLPPPKAPKPEGILEQSRRALSPDRGEPRSQPAERKR